MYNLKGFLRIDNQQNNTIDVISTLGELSTQSMTYSREKGIYKSDISPGISFISFTSRNDQNPPVPVSAEYSEHILQICHKMINYATQFGDSVSAQAIANDLFNTFQGLIVDFESGPMVSTPTLSLPEWISWQNPVYSNGLNRIKIWLSDQAFKRQFDDYEILLVNPVDDMMDLMRSATVTENALSFRTKASEMELIASIKSGEPETNIRAQTYTLTNLLDPNRKFSVSWYAIIYGAAGDSPDIIKEKIIETLATVPSIGISEWQQAIPDLFSTTEFVFVPKWLVQAIPDRTSQAGIYSPVTNVTQQLNAMISLFDDIEPEYINEHLQSLTIPYRSLTVYSLSGKFNLNSLFKLTEKYSDLINVGTSSSDFSRMSIKTQNFANMLQELVMIAENETEYAELPVYVRRLTRYNKNWISRSYDGVQYLVYTKSNDTGL